jgi:hypothetical protein
VDFVSKTILLQVSESYFERARCKMWIFALIFVAILVIFSWWWNSPSVKGWRGELAIRRVLGTTKEGERYVVNDLTIPLENGKSCQIDHILIDKNGVLVIETKNYAGRIYGSENQQEWTQVLAYGKVKNRFYNPVRQNKTHLYHISNVLHLCNFRIMI